MTFEFEAPRAMTFEELRRTADEHGLPYTDEELRAAERAGAAYDAAVRILVAQTCRHCRKYVHRDPDRDGWITADGEQFCTAYTVGVYEHEPEERQ